VIQLNNEIVKFQETLGSERKIREENENIMFRMLEDINAKFQGEVETEKHKRLTSQDDMLKLLEDMCNRVERKNFRY